MKIFFGILKNDFKILLKDVKMLIVIFLMPILLIIYFSYVVFPAINRDTTVEPFDIGIVDKEDSIQSRVLSDQLSSIKLIRKVYKTNEKTARSLIDENRIAAAIIIPDGFTSSINSGKNKDIIVLANSRMYDRSIIVRSLITGAANVVSSGQGLLYTYYNFLRHTPKLSSAELNSEFNQVANMIVMKSLDRKEVISEIRTYPDSNLTPAEYYTAALFTMFLMFAGMPAIRLLTLEKGWGILNRIAVTNTGSFRMILPKLIITIILSSVQLLTVILGTTTIVKNYWGASIPIIIELFISGAIAVSCWSLFVSSISGTQRSAEVIGNLSILLMALLGGSIYPLAKLPEILKPVSLITLNRWIQEGFAKIFSGDSHPDISMQVEYLFMISAVLVLASVFILKFKKAR